MVDTKDADAGFDRRSLIKRGLVAGGIAATAPVISTFNAPAFASSPGEYLIAINIITSGGVIQGLSQRQPVSPDGGCTDLQNDFPNAEEDPGEGEILIDWAISPGPTGTTRTLTFTLQGEAAAECSFTDARRRGANGVACGDVGTGIGTDSVAFTINLLSNSQYHFIVTCV